MPPPGLPINMYVYPFLFWAVLILGPRCGSFLQVTLWSLRTVHLLVEIVKDAYVPEDLANPLLPSTSSMPFTPSLFSLGI